jgi:ABC-type antimicrobial peptide transport system permease subunit
MSKFLADPWSLAVLGLVGLIACAVPARRVSRIDPNEALRAE